MPNDQRGEERSIDRQDERDNYYMRVAYRVRERADCLGTEIGAVIVSGDRIISTGVNGTPSDYESCHAGGCVRCLDSRLAGAGLDEHVVDKSHVPGAALDHCICVHAEENALASAARFGIRVEEATIYTTSEPCMSCLRKCHQAGIARVVYARRYKQFTRKTQPELYAQRQGMIDLFSRGDKTRYQRVRPRRPAKRELHPLLREAA
jgi:deoxycytidylate deaminase